MMLWPSIGTGVLNYLLGLLLQFHPLESLGGPVAIGTFAGELLLLATWVAWSPRTFTSRIGLGYLTCVIWTILWWLGFLGAEKTIHQIAMGSDTVYAMYSTCIILTICSAVFATIRVICGWEITAGGRCPAMRFSLRGLLIGLAATCVFTAAWQLIAASRTWAVGIGGLLTLVGVGSSPVIVFAILRSHLRLSLLVFPLVWTLGVMGMFASSLSDGGLVAPSVTSFLIACFASNGYQMIVVSSWQREGYRLVMAPLDGPSAGAEHSA